MDLGYDGKLYILASDHRGSFKKKMFGISGREPSDAETRQLQEAKYIVWQGLQRALEAGAPGDAAGILVDEEMGARVAREAKETGVLLAMPVEKSGQDVFDFEYEDFGKHIEDFDPDFSKVLVRWNPDDDPETKKIQGERLKQLGDWLHDHDRRFLFELLVPASDRQLRLVDGDGGSYDSHIRPVMMLEAISEILGAGVEPDIWKIEGIDSVEDCELVSRLIRSGGRTGVKAVVLGRGADDTKVDHWLRMGAPVAGYSGFAIGRTIWWDGVERWKNGSLSDTEAAEAIGESYRRFIDVYQSAAG